MIAATLDAALRPVEFLLGTWRGEGDGEYPTIQPFKYQEEIRFTHIGKPFLVYTQRTRAADDSRPLHSEMGYLRMVGADRAEFVIAQPIGVTEIDVGTVTGTQLDVRSVSIGTTPTAKPVTAVARTFWLEGDTLRYTLRMALGGGPLRHHLAATFQRAET